MSHLLEGMFYSGEVPWHGLGTYVGDKPVTSDQAIVAAGLDWEVEKWPLLAQDPSDAVKMSQVPEQFAVVRKTDKRVLGVVGARYKPLQNRPAFGLLDSLAGENGAIHYNTAGSLKDGKLVWILADLKGSTFDVVPGDTVNSYLMLSNPHDGSGTLFLLLCDTRVVCANTHRLAVDEAKGSGKLVAVRHTGDIENKVKEAERLLGFAVQNHATHAERLKMLAGKQIGVKGWDGLLDHLAPIPLLDTNPAIAKVDGILTIVDPEESNDRKFNNVLALRTELTTLYENGIGMDIPGVRGTGWGALSAVTQYTTHHKRVRVDKGDFNKIKSRRFESLLMGSGADMVDNAFSYLMAA